MRFPYGTTDPGAANFLRNLRAACLRVGRSVLQVIHQAADVVDELLAPLATSIARVIIVMIAVTGHRHQRAPHVRVEPVRSRERPCMLEVETSHRPVRGADRSRASGELAELGERGDRHGLHARPAQELAILARSPASGEPIEDLHRTSVRPGLC